MMQRLNGVQYFILMDYKQKSGNGPGGSWGSTGRIDDERKLLQLWRDEEVDDDYQSIVLHFFDNYKNRSQLHRLIQAQLKSTYQKDSFYFLIEKLIQQREKTIGKLQQQVAILDRYKKQKGEPNLEPVCILLDHTRKVHLLIAEQVHEMFNAYGHPKTTRVGSSYISLFQEFNEELEFLKDSLLKFFMPFSSGFDPLFLELSQKLRKCYANESLVYDENIEQLLNLNASYLYRLLRAHQRMLDSISAANAEQEEAAQYYQRGHSYKINARNVLDAIAEEGPKYRTTELTERFESSRMEYKNINNRFSTPKNTQTQSQYPRVLSPLPRKTTAQMGIQKQPPMLQLVKNNIHIPRQEKEKVAYERPPLLKNIPSPNHNEQIIQRKLVKTPRKSNNHMNIMPQEQQSKRLRFIRKIQPSQHLPERPTPTPTHHAINHQRTHTDGTTIVKHRPRNTKTKQSLPKLYDSRDKIIDGSKVQCLCRRRYKEKHCEHEQEQMQLTEEELEKRRRIIIKEVQMKYKVLAQREMRHQLSKLGDITYHKLRNQQQSRIKTQKGHPP